MLGMPPRSLYNSKDHEALAVIFVDEITSISSVRYHQSATGTKKNEKALIRQRHLLRRLKALQANLCFTKNSIRGGLRLFLKRKQLAELPPTVHDVWVGDIDKRIRTMCRHIGQMELKTPGKSCLKILFQKKKGDASPAESSEADRDEEDFAAEEVEEEASVAVTEDVAEENPAALWRVSFCTHARKPFRVPHDKPKHKKVWGAVQKHKDGAEPSSLVVGEWHDGFTSDLDITIADYDVGQKLHKDKGPADSMWSATEADGTALCLSWVKFKGPLIVLRRGKGNAAGQICQLKLAWFTDLDDEKRKEHGISIMKQVAEAYLQGKVSVDNLYAERDRLLKLTGLVPERGDDRAQLPDCRITSARLPPD